MANSKALSSTSVSSFVVSGSVLSHMRLEKATARTLTLGSVNANAAGLACWRRNARNVEREGHPRALVPAPNLLHPIWPNARETKGAR